MPEPGTGDLNFARPTTGREPRPRKSRPGLQIPREYADFRLKDGRYLVEVMGPEFFGPDNSRIMEEQQEKLSEGNYPLAQMVQDGSDFSSPRADKANGNGKVRIPVAESPSQSKFLNTRAQVLSSTFLPDGAARQPGNNGRETPWKDDLRLDHMDPRPVARTPARDDAPRFLMPRQSKFHDDDTNALDRIAGAAWLAVESLYEGP